MVELQNFIFMSKLQNNFFTKPQNKFLCQIDYFHGNYKIKFSIKIEFLDKS